MEFNIEDQDPNKDNRPESLYDASPEAAANPPPHQRFISHLTFGWKVVPGDRSDIRGKKIMTKSVAVGVDSKLHHGDVILTQRTENLVLAANIPWDNKPLKGNIPKRSDYEPHSSARYQGTPR